MVISKFRELTFESKLEFAIKYYSIFAKWYEIKITKGQIKLLAFISVRGTISSSSAREEFCKRFNSSLASIHNMVHQMRPTGVLLKKGNKIVINPQLALNLDEPLTLNLVFNHGESE